MKFLLRPVPASRAKVPRRGKPYYPKRYNKWRQTAFQQVPTYTQEAIAKPVLVNVWVVIPRAKHSKLIVPAGDGDNYEKSLYDMLQAKGYLQDDKFIVGGEWQKVFAPYDKTGYAIVDIFECPEYKDLTEEQYEAIKC